MSRFRPMLGKTIKDPEQLRYPLLGSPKLDGIRALVLANEDVVSRKLKCIPNRWVQETFGLSTLSGLDGELIAGDPTEPGCWNRTDSAVMSVEHDRSVPLRFYYFDRWDQPDVPFSRRLASIRVRHPLVVPVPQALITGPVELRRFHRNIVAKGYEGTMYRDPQGGYKHGRSTLSEQLLLKHKDFEDCEVKIIGMKEERENRNPQTRSLLGYAKRSSHKANKVGKGVVGSLLVRAVNGYFKGREFPVGMGISDELGRDAMQHPRRYLGRLATVRYRIESGADKPWNCRLVGLRRD